MTMGPDTTDTPRSWQIWGALTIVYIVWGSTYLGIMVVIETIPPMLGGAMRFTIAGLLLVGFLLLRHGRSALTMNRRQFGGAALVGLLLLAGGNGMVAVAQQHISSGMAALLVASIPLLLVVMRVMARDRPSLLTTVGVLIGFSGVALLALTGGTGDDDGIGVVVILLASVSWALGSFLSGRMPMPSSPLAASAVEMVVGGLAMIVVGAAVGERLDLASVSGASWTALAYLIGAGSLIAYTSYIWLLQNAPISLVATYAYVNPVVAVILGMLILNETLTTQMVLGGLVIVVGVALVVSTERTRRRPAAAAPVKRQEELSHS
ncbi:EamA family transporter [Sinosporangium siamense]|nr:EamA family transporter [Sinosporangium siamense]